jgi:hypothetical protein
MLSRTNVVQGRRDRFHLPPWEVTADLPKSGRSLSRINIAAHNTRLRDQEHTTNASRTEMLIATVYQSSGDCFQSHFNVFLKFSRAVLKIFSRFSTRDSQYCPNFLVAYVG